jgi:hypothetical protein
MEIFRPRAGRPLPQTSKIPQPGRQDYGPGPEVALPIRAIRSGVHPRLWSVAPTAASDETMFLFCSQGQSAVRDNVVRIPKSDPPRVPITPDTPLYKPYEGVQEGRVEYGRQPHWAAERLRAIR